MRKFVLFAVIIALLASMGFTVYAAPPPDGPPGLERAIEAQEAHTDRLLNIPGVVGTAVGFGENGLPAVKIYTAETGIRGLPEVLEGVPVEVVVTGRFCARQDPTTARQERPVPIGVSTGHPDITAGTIGARVTDGNHVYALSNNHVYANSNEATIGDSALQPGPYDGGTDPADSIGTLYDFVPIKFDGSNNIMDAAIARCSTGSLGYATLSYGYGAPGSTVVDAFFVGQAVQKYGRTTGMTHGEVSAINATVDVCYEARGPFRCVKSARFVGQIAITPGAFSAGGDSGSLIVTDDENKNPVALLFAGSDTHTIASPIGPILDRFGVVIDSGSTDAPPTVSITNPSEGSTVSGTITVTADASDDNGVTQVEFFIDGSPVGVDSDGLDGWSASWVTTNYGDGSYTVSATATDTTNQTNSDSIMVTVGNVNDPPTAYFTYNSSGLTCYFDASGSNDPDGSIVTYAWDFGDGGTESGVTVTHTYAEGGTYEVILTVTDDDGDTDTETKPVTVSDAVATVSVSSITYATEGGRNSDRHLLITVALEDDAGNPVGGASVSIDVYRYSALYGSGTGTTGTDGTVTFKLTNAPSGTYTTTVTDVTATGLTWDGATPPNSYAK